MLGICFLGPFPEADINFIATLRSLISFPTGFKFPTLEIITKTHAPPQIIMNGKREDEKFPSNGKGENFVTGVQEMFGTEIQPIGSTG